MRTENADPNPHHGDEQGLPAVDLPDEDLANELAQLHDTRHEMFLHGSAPELVRHTERLSEVEAEYLIRYPVRDVETDGPQAGAPAA